MQYRLGFLGAGNMAEAIATAAIRKNVLAPGQMIASDPTDARRELFNKMGIATTTNNQDVIQNAAQILIAVKPQVMQQAAADLGASATSEQIVISIMAGVSSAKLGAAIAAGGSKNATPRVIRVMPNTPLMVGKGMAGVCLGAHARPGDEALTLELFGAGGEVVVVDEAKIDAITAVSGSGPAYVFYLAEAMERAAKELGLTREATLLVRQTILGSAMLLAESSDSAAELRRKVTSPGGTTEAAIKHFDGNKSTEVIVNAIKAAEKRSKELGA
ncbi:MAG: pyrroline-5-carboxylate reductase [Planctomycetota bacterium]|nr:pyrroline-5-carboxylate reductase [Planctomycetota bacterium]